MEKRANRHSHLVVGIGNEIRNDDAVGLFIADEVGRRAGTSSIMVKKLSAGGWQLFHEIEGFDFLVVVDAYFTKESVPGRVRIHKGDIMPVRDLDAASAHLLSVPDAVALSAHHGVYTPRLLGMITVDVGASCLSFGTGLSADVANAVPKAADAVFKLIETL